MTSLDLLEENYQSNPINDSITNQNTAAAQFILEAASSTPKSRTDLLIVDNLDSGLSNPLPEGGSSPIVNTGSGPIQNNTNIITNYGSFPLLERVAEPVDYFNNKDKTAIKEYQLRMNGFEYDPIYENFYKVDTKAADVGDYPTNSGTTTPQFVSSPFSAVNEKQLQQIFPNLRDLAASSNMTNIKHGMIFRSARPFVNNCYELFEIMCQGLDIRTVLDLRAPDLSPNRGEHLSRQMELVLYQAGCSGTTSKDRQVQKELLKRQKKAENLIVSGMDNMEEHLIKTKEHWDNYISARKSGLYVATDDSELPSLNFAKEQLNLVDQGLAYCQEGRSRLEDIRNERSKRVLYVVNFFDTPEFHARVQNQLKQPDSLMTVPFLAACKLGDKMLKTNNAEFYFSRFFISDASVQDTYIEMLQTAGGPVCDCLKLMLVTEPPILFHCTLGKDRTGLLALFTLHILGASESAIMFDYNLTDYSDVAFKRFVKDFIVGASGLTERFTEAKVETMRETIDWLLENYGSLDNYLDLIGFNEDLRMRFRERFLIDPSLHKVKGRYK